MRSPHRKPRLHVALGLALLGGCALDEAPRAPSARALRDESSFESQVPIGPDVEALGAGNRAFAFDLYRQLASADVSANLVFSPYSISSALALTYAGARGKTAEELASTLHFELSPSQLHGAFGAAAQQLAARGTGARGADGTPFRLNIGNGLWAQQGYPFEPAFLDIAQRHYRASLESLQFATAPEPSRQIINARVARDTEGLIRDFLPPDFVTPLTRLILTNTVYFNASWQVPFSASATHDAPFTRRDGSTVTAALMSKILTVPYAEGEGYRAVALPYASSELSFVAVLPDQGELAALEAAVNETWFDAVRASLRPALVEVGLPKLDFRAKASLPNTLVALGSKEAFSPAADFSGLSAQKLQLNDVVHEAVIKVFEGGTIAAAATGVGAVTSVVPPPSAAVRLDRPFLFAIVDAPTGQVLFLGRVTDPTAG